MSLRLALVIDGDQSGAKKALEDTATGIGKVQTAANGAGTEVKKIPEGLKETATEADKAKTAVGDLGTAAEGTGTSFGNLKTLAIGAIGGIAGALAAQALEWGANAALKAATDYFDEVTNSATNIAADLEAHKTLIGGVKGLWDEAAGAASSYGANSKPVLQFQASQNVDRLSGDFRSELDRVGGTDYVSNPYRLQDGPLQDTLVGLKADLADGLADIIAWRDQVVAIANETELGSTERDIAADFIAKTETAVQLQAELQRSVDIFKALTGDAAAAATAMGAAADKMTATGTSATEALPGLREYAELLRSINGGASPGFARVPGTGFSVPSEGFARGGWTGGREGEPVDIVHGQEFVVRAGPAAQYRGLLESINNGDAPVGYASGGFVGGFSGTTANDNTAGAVAGSIGGEIASALGPLRGMIADLALGAMKAKDVWDIVGGYAERLYESVLTNALGAIENALLGVEGGQGDGFGGVIGGFFTSLFGGGNFIGGTHGAAPLQLGFQAGVGHSGAIIGRAANSRYVDAALFDNAPRYHSGTSQLGPGERPFIGMDGEEIGWPGQLAQKYGGKMQVVVNNYAGASVSVTEDEDSAGGRRASIQIEEATAAALARPNSKANRAARIVSRVTRR